MNRNQSGGFVLLATIWLLAAMTLAMGYIAAWSNTIQNSVYDSAAEQHWRYDRKATLSTILYIGATQGVSYAGITTGKDVPVRTDEFNVLSGDPFSVTGDELRLDGRLYQGLGNSIFRLQDTGSLIGLRAERGSPQLESLLRKHGASSDQISRLISALKDYIDRDDLISLDGIEKTGYRAYKLLPPTNRFLISPTQIANVAGWHSVFGKNLDLLISEMTVHTGNKSNFNTLTPTGMEILAGLGVSEAQQITAYRQEGHFKTLGDVNQLVDVLIPVDALAFSSIPDPYIRASFLHPNSRREQWIGIRFTPSSGLGPWEIDYNVSRQRIVASSLEPHPNESNIQASSPAAIFR